MKTFGWEPTDEELNDMVNVIDADGDGDISFNEFVWLMTRWKILHISCIYLNVSREFKDGDIENEIREAFRVFDKEGNGFITSQDLMEVILRDIQ